MKKSYSVLFLILATILTLSACGHKSSDEGVTAAPPTNPGTTTTPETTTNPTTTTTPAAPAAQLFTGIFVDGPVEGLTWTSVDETGTTDAAGAFKYEPGAHVQFKLGNVVLGQTPGKALITPVDLVRDVDSAATITDPRVVQITQFLMTVNANPVSQPTMSMSPFAITNAASVPAVDLSVAPLDQATLTTLLGSIVPAKILVTPADALAHLQTALTVLKPTAGVFAALDSAANPKLGLKLSMTPNLVGDAFDVTGIAAGIDGSTWSVTGSLSLNGSLQATGGGTGTPAAPTMTITGTVASPTQLTASVNFTLNNAAQQAAVTLEKAVAPAAASKLALAADPGVTNATQIQHIAADLSVLADGTVNAHLVEGEFDIANVKQGGRYAKLTGVVTSTGAVIAIGGLPGSSETFLSRGPSVRFPPPSPSVVLMTGTTTSTAGVISAVSAAFKSSDLTGGGLTQPPLSFVTATNAFVGVYVGTHTDTTQPGTVAFGVNNDGSVNGYARFILPVARIFPESDDLLEGTVSAGGVLAPTAAQVLANVLAPIAGNPGVPGLVMTNDDGITAPAFPGSMGGTIAAGSVTGGAWTTGPVVASGTFTADLLP